LPLSDDEKKKVREQGLEQTYLTANQASFATIDPMALATDAVRTRDVFVSGATVLGSYAALLAEAPAAAQRDFALFDCGACHHELRSRFPTDARVRRPLAPGRPPPAFWTLVLARQGASLAQIPEADLDADVEALYAAFGQRPFGNWDEIRPAASRLAETCSKLGQALTHAPLDETASRKLLAGIVGAPHDADRDYHAARQLAWAVREILRDRARIAYGADNSPAARRIDELFGGGPWQGDLRLKLPAGQEQTITKHLSESLEAISSFNPNAYRDLLKQVPLDEPSANPNR
jgi:hypothetical protein